MKILTRQRNSKMCIICGLDNPAGVQAPFYSMADGSVISLFQFRPEHQSYPQRVHGGMITAMLDEMGLRGFWAHELSEKCFGVTMSIQCDLRKPVPYDEPLIARGVVTHDSSRFFAVDAAIYRQNGERLANGVVKYIKLDVEKIVTNGMTVHEQMPYLIEDSRREIDFEPEK